MKGKNLMKKSQLKLVSIVALIVIILDQISKFLVTKYVVQNNEIQNFGINIFYNTGMAFGFNSGNSRNIILSFLVIFIIVWFLKNQIGNIDKKTSVAIAMMLGGGISNLIDRFFRKGVLDFIKILFIPYFNIADLCICTGWMLIIVFLIIYSREPINKDKLEG